MSDLIKELKQKLSVYQDEIETAQKSIQEAVKVQREMAEKHGKLLDEIRVCENQLNQIRGIISQAQVTIDGFLQKKLNLEDKLRQALEEEEPVG